MRKVTVLITNQCSLRCGHCFSCSGPAGPSELEDEGRRRVLDCLCVLGTGAVVASGGEPTLRWRRLEQFLADARDRRLATGLLTNGLHLSESRVRRLTELGLQEAAVSVYTSDLAGLRCHDRYLTKTLTALQRLDAAGIATKATIPVHDANGAGVVELYARLAESGLRRVRCRLYVVTPAGRAESLPQRLVRHEVWQGVLDGVRAVASRSGAPEVVFSSYPATSERHGVCPQGLVAADPMAAPDPHVSEAGDLVLCGLLLRRREHIVCNLATCEPHDAREAIRRYGRRLARASCQVHASLARCPLQYRENRLVGEALPT
jgi:pyruvate-formate lyase-activating enzyme